MKKLILVILLGLNLGAFAQSVSSTQVPNAITQAFNNQYSHTKKMAWTQNDESFIACFDSHRKKTYVQYSPNLFGNYSVQTLEVETVKLPRKIRKQLKNDYGHFIVEDVLKIDSQHGTIYKTVIGKAEEAYTVIFSQNGKLISSTPINQPLTLK